MSVFRRGRGEYVKSRTKKGKTFVLLWTEMKLFLPSLYWFALTKCDALFNLRQGKYNLICLGVLGFVTHLNWSIIISLYIYKLGNPNVLCAEPGSSSHGVLSRTSVPTTIICRIPDPCTAQRATSSSPYSFSNPSFDFLVLPPLGTFI